MALIEYAIEIIRHRYNVALNNRMRVYKFVILFDRAINITQH